MKEKRRLLLYAGLLVIIICACVLQYSYSMYQSKMDVTITTTTGDIICDVSVDTNENYIENNKAFFYVIIRNYKTVNKVEQVSAVDVDYTLTITNKENSVGLFQYIDEDGNSNEKGESSVTINSSISRNRKTKRYKVYVTTDTNLKTDVNFKVNLDAHQKDMR